MKLRRQTIRIITPLRWEALNGPHLEIFSGLVLGDVRAFNADLAISSGAGRTSLGSIIGENSLIQPAEGPHLRQAAEPDFNPDVNWWREFEMGRLT